MKQLLFLIVCIPIFCIAQTKTTLYAANTKYLELVEITDKIMGLSKPIDSSGKLHTVDSIYYAFKLTPYPDQVKKYEIETSLNLILCHGRDTLVNIIYPISTDSGFFAFPIPLKYKTVQFQVTSNTNYKRRWRKDFKHYKEVLLSDEINRIINPLFSLINMRGSRCCICPVGIRNTLEPLKSYDIDKIARLAPGVY